jgi:hypothetical protein
LSDRSPTGKERPGRSIGLEPQEGKIIGALRRKQICSRSGMDPISQNAAVTTGCLIKPIRFNSLSDCLAVDAMIGRQKIRGSILGNVVHQSARAQERAIVVK